MGKVDKRIVRSCRLVESRVGLAVMVFSRHRQTAKAADD